MSKVVLFLNPSEIKSEYLNGAYKELASLLGTDAVLKIHKSYRGQQLTLPVKLFSKEFIAMKIIEEYDGKNVKRLASKFGYSEKWIRKILKEHIGQSNHCIEKEKEKKEWTKK